MMACKQLHVHVYMYVYLSIIIVVHVGLTVVSEHPPHSATALEILHTHNEDDSKAAGSSLVSL